ncbi:MAG: hypothetical protein KGH79_00370 [Patescibacteria group bacterium]|nr:hypothetical protein [Patescibacteria group bacterium]
MNKNQIIGAVVGIIIIGGGAFYAGEAYGKGQAPTRGAGFAAGANFAGRGGRAGGNGFTIGQILSAGNGSITIQSTMSSSTEIVLVGNSTQILKTTAGGASDLTPGTSVVVTGTQNSDGSMTATSIQVRPAGLNVPDARGGAGTQIQ